MFAIRILHWAQTQFSTEDAHRHLDAVLVVRRDHDLRAGRRGLLDEDAHAAVVVGMRVVRRRVHRALVALLLRQPPLVHLQMISFIFQFFLSIFILFYLLMYSENCMACAGVAKMSTSKWPVGLPLGSAQALPFRRILEHPNENETLAAMQVEQSRGIARTM